MANGKSNNKGRKDLTMITLKPYVSLTSIANTGNDPLISLDKRAQQNKATLAQSVEINTTARVWPNFESDPLAMAFFKALTELPVSNNAESYVDDVNELINSFVDINTGNLAFLTLDQQKDILQRTLEKVGTDSDLTEPLTSALYRTANLQNQMTIWMQDIILSDGEIKDNDEW